MELSKKLYQIGPWRDPERHFLIKGPLKSASSGPFEGPFWAQEGPLIYGIVAKWSKLEGHESCNWKVDQ